MTVELVILNYNGQHHLEHLLPTALREAENYGSDCQVVVLDNRSTKDDVAWVAREFPSVKVWLAPRNEYLFSYNEYAKQSTAEILILLNNDLKLCENFLPPLLRYFNQEDVFSVGAAALDWDGENFLCGPARLDFKNGFYSWDYQVHKQELAHTLFTSGGWMAVDRKKFLHIKGFDPIYAPAYIEDVEICFRAWRHGFRCIFEPQSQVLHRDKGSWNFVVNSNLDQKLLRNSLLFQFCHLPMRRARIQRWASIIKISLAGKIKNNWLISYVKAMAEHKKIKKKQSLYPVSENELIDLQSKIQKKVSTC
jgi:GT2 family glycosyltransferase